MNQSCNNINWIATVFCLALINSALADEDTEMVANAMHNNKIEVLTLSGNDHVNSCKHDGVFEVRFKNSTDSWTLVCQNGNARMWNGFPERQLDGYSDYSEWHYANGRYNGTYKSHSHYSNSAISDVDDIKEYKNGRLDGESHLLMNGHFVSSSSYIQDKLISTTTAGSDGGTITCLYEDKKEVQVEKCYEDNTKKLFSIGEKVHGLNHGHHWLYDDDGSLLTDTLYEHGKFVRTIDKKTWFREYGGKKVFFDVVSKIENGNCVYRDLRSGKELEVYGIDRGHCQ